MTVDKIDSDKMAKTGGRLPNFSWSGPNRIRDLSKFLLVVRSTEVRWPLFELGFFCKKHLGLRFDRADPAKSGTRERRNGGLTSSVAALADRPHQPRGRLGSPKRRPDMCP
jgi:hypothetical protein